MIRRFILAAVALHALYAMVWLTIGAHNKLVFERWAVTLAATVLAITYWAFAIAGIWAQRSRLNVALALQKLFLALFFTILTLPGLWGVIWRDAPYRVVGNPFSFWVPPAWLRVYLYLGVTITSIGFLFEFVVRNWGMPRRPTWPLVDRRKRAYGRRASDQPGYVPPVETDD